MSQPHRSFLRLFFVLFIIPICSDVLVAQSGDIRGIVADSSNGSRLQFVNVVLVGTSIGTTTNAEGFFLLPGIEPGEYQLRASYVGYEPAVQQVRLEPGQTHSISIVLAPVPIRFEEIPVSARGGAELIKSSTSKHVIERRTLERVPLGAQGDILQSLKILPGIVSTSDISSKFHVRGGASDQNLFYLDDIKIYHPYHALGIFGIFDPDLVRSTEIYTGSFPAGLGGRLSSVVRLNTRDGNALQPSVSVGVNSLSIRASGELPHSQRLRSLVIARKSLFDNTWKRFLSGTSPVDFYDVAVKTTFDDPSTQTKASGIFFVTRDRLTSRHSHLPSYHWTNNGGGVSVSGLLDDRVFVKSTASYTSYEAKQVPPENSDIHQGSTSVQDFTIRSEMTVYLGMEEFLIGGFDFGFPSVRSSLTNSSNITRTIADTYAAVSSWIRYQSTFERWSVDAGIHAELGLLFTQREGLRALQPRLNIGYEILPTVQLKAGYGRFAQNLMTINNEDELISLFDYWILIPEEVGPQRADHLVASVDWQAGASIALTAEAYHKNYRSNVIFNREKVDAVDPDYINGTAVSYGGEVLARIRSGDLDLFLSYGFGRSEVRSLGESYAPRFDRRHSVKALAVADVFPGMSVTARWEFGSGFPFTPATSSYFRFFLEDLSPESYLNGNGESYLRLGSRNSGRLPAYFRFDLAFEYSFHLWHAKGKLGIHVLNLFDRRNLFYFDRASGRRVDMIRFFPSVNASISF